MCVLYKLALIRISYQLVYIIHGTMYICSCVCVCLCVCAGRRDAGRRAFRPQENVSTFKIFKYTQNLSSTFLSYQIQGSTLGVQGEGLSKRIFSFVK